MSASYLCLSCLILLPVVNSGLAHRDAQSQIHTRHRRSSDCDGETVETEGEYVGVTNYFPQDCHWNLTASSDSIIFLISSFFDLQPCNENTTLQSKQSKQSKCDFVELSDGSAKSQNFVGRFYGQDKVRYISKTNKLYVFLWPRPNSHDGKGFEMKYSFLPKKSTHRGCNGTVTEEGSLVLPQSGLCLIGIQANNNKRVKLKFTDFNLESGLCSNDTVKVYDGVSSAANELGSFCDHEAPVSITSSTTNLFLYFNTSEMHSKKNPTLTYTFVDGDSNGPIVDYPIPEPLLTTTVPTTTVPTTTVPTTTVPTTTVPTTTVPTTTVPITTVPTTPVPTTTVPTTTVPTTPVPTTTVPTTTVPTTTVPTTPVPTTPVPTCSSSMDAFKTDRTTSDDIKVDAYYSRVHDCLWTVTAPEHNQILLTSKYFNLGENNKSSCDFVMLFDGKLIDKHWVGKLTGRMDVRFISQTNKLIIHFKSTCKESGDGFHFKMSFIPSASNRSCNRVYNETPGSIFSPHYPDKYPNSLTCLYRIQASDKKKVKLEFGDFQLHAGSCPEDFLAVYDGKSSASTKIGTYCGDDAPLSITSESSSLFLHFHTDVIWRETGFNLTYTFVDGNNTAPIVTNKALAPLYKSPSSCVNTTVNTSASIEYWFEDSYLHNSSCLWTITAPPDNKIVIMSTDMNIETSRNCGYDYVELFDGDFQSGASVGTFCGRTKVRFISQTNLVFIYFRSDDSLSVPGFKFDVSFIPASPSTTCNRSTDAKTGIISSPNYPADYPNNARCLYSIQAPDDMKVKLEFEDFVLVRGHCSEDYLTVYDGKSSASSELGTFCGRRGPLNVTSSSNTLLLYFHTDDIIIENGFNLTYTFVDDDNSSGQVTLGDPPSLYDPDCSSIITQADTILRSPEISNEFYPPRKMCRTDIRAPEGQGVELRFLKFDLEDSLDCGFDHINITYWSEQGNWTTVRLCDLHGFASPSCFQSFRNTLILDFKSDDTFEATGYMAQISFFSLDGNSTGTTPRCEDNCQGYCYSRGDGFHCACPDGTVPPSCNENTTWMEPMNESISVTEGENASLNCRVNHNHTSTEWDKGTGLEMEPLYTDDHFSLGPELVIHGVQVDDSGSYTCTVYAGNRIMSQTVKLIVKKNESHISSRLSNKSEV